MNGGLPALARSKSYAFGALLACVHFLMPALAHAGVLSLWEAQGNYWDLGSGAGEFPVGQLERTFFDGSAVPYGDSNGLGVYPSIEAGAGHQFGGLFVLELDAYWNPEINISRQADWMNAGLCVMPAWRFHSGGYFSQIFGFRFGPSFLTGSTGGFSTSAPPPGNGFPGSVQDDAPGAYANTQSGTGFDAGLVWRIEGREGKEDSSTDLALELAYDFIYFPYINDNPGRALGPNGRPLALNLSGFSLKVVVLQWLGAGRKAPQV